jgi:hypothetical protein
MATKTAVVAAMAGVLGWAVHSPALAQTAIGPTGARTAPSELSAQSRRPPPRARIRVTPAYPYRTFSTPYPVPYRAEYPGPGFVRQCTSWLAAENRVSGQVIVPQMRCWWQPGRSDLESGYD